MEDNRRRTEWKRKPTLVMQASQPEIEAAGLRQLGSVLQRAMQGQTGRPAVDLRVSAKELTLRAGPGSQTFTGVEGSFDNPPGGVQAIVSFRIPGIDMPEPVKIRAVRNRQTSPPSSGFELSTGDGCLPCDLLAAGLPELGGLVAMPVSRLYQGQSRTPALRRAIIGRAKLSGQLLGVDLDRLVSDHFPHKLSGAADVTINTARFLHGRLEQASGTIIAGPGVVSRSLLLSAARHLPFTTGRGIDLDLLADLVPYDRIALDLFNGRQGLENRRTMFLGQKQHFDCRVRRPTAAGGGIYSNPGPRKHVPSACHRSNGLAGRTPRLAPSRRPANTRGNGAIGPTAPAPK